MGEAVILAFAISMIPPPLFALSKQMVDTVVTADTIILSPFIF
jgi:hypothetical protein